MSKPPSPAPLYRIRISLLGSEPEIWRLAEVDSGLTLDALHPVLQIVMGWQQAHLHSFTDADPHARPAQQVPRPRTWLDDGSIDEGLAGLPETDYTLGDVLTESSGPLFYEYDFGDGWLHRIELIEVIPATGDEPLARVVRGERRAPLEDSGGIHGYIEYLEILGDPSHEQFTELRAWVDGTVGPWQAFDPEKFDADEVNRELARFEQARAGIAAIASAPSIDTLVERVYPGVQSGLREYVRRTNVHEPVAIGAEEAAAMLAPYLWLIRRVGLDGLTLTAAGWLPPVVVSDAMRELGWQDRWFGKMNREDQTYPILDLRARARRHGLLRKLKGRLVLGAAAKKMIDDPVGLWWYLARRINLRHGHEAERDATLLLALEVAAATRHSRADMLEAIVYGLEALDWRLDTRRGDETRAAAALCRDAWDDFFDLGVFETPADPHDIIGVTEAGRKFARAILQS